MTERERADGLMTLGQSVAASPELYPVEFDPSCGRVRLIRLREEDYRAASFLDERLLVRGATETSIDWMEFAAAAEPIPLACDFIFHIGHVGSTLLARLLGTHERVFALREPALLRLLATGPGDDARLETLLRLYSRTWRAPQRSLVKATSFVSQIGPAMLRKAPSSRAVLMTVRAPTYIAGILGGTATRAQLVLWNVGTLIVAVADLATAPSGILFGSLLLLVALGSFALSLRTAHATALQPVPRWITAYALLLLFLGGSVFVGTALGGALPGQ